MELGTIRVGITGFLLGGAPTVAPPSAIGCPRVVGFEPGFALIPYVEEPTLTLGPLTLTAFGLLVCLAVWVGVEVVVRRAPRFGLEPDTARSLVVWTIVWGFVGSHVFEVLAYQPGTLRRDPLALLRVWASMSSFGGMAGGLGAALLLMRRRGMGAAQMLRFVDLLAFAFPFAWIFGRLGCSLRHDHLGIASRHWLAVAFPDGPRFDLGLLELFFTLLVAAAFAALGRRARPPGFFLGLFFSVYGPVRFLLDTLRSEDLRHLGWTPAQYLCVASSVAGAWILLRALRARQGA
jgi:phosphatidylglycerol:prolipoprotein diacylglycerol transferase